jgi:RNA polymerase sigma factor (sigma-70 family)
MPANQMDRVIEHLRQSAGRGAVAQLADAELLTRFVDCRDLGALEAIVRRHGPMVWSVCRRLVPNHHDAEEAFQAAFLVLLRKAAAVTPREMLANWLYGVARRTALNARSMLNLRRRRERQVNHMPEPQSTSFESSCAFEPCLDEELSRLPDKYRLVIVLCDLEGKSRTEVARQLGLPEGTVASRLARARTKLARRLARHGLLASGGTLALMLSEDAAAKAPATVVSSTIKMLTTAAMGGPIPGGINSLMQGVLKAMLLNKLKKVTAVVVLVAIAGICGISSWTTAADPPAPKPHDKDSVAKGPESRDGSHLGVGSIQGFWTLVSAEMDGRRLRVEDGAAQLIVTNEYWIWMERDRDRGFTYKLHPQSSPKQVDLAPLFPTGSEGKKVFAIYQLDGDTLMVCEGYKDRPTIFSAPADSGRALFTYQRTVANLATTPKPFVAPPVQVASARPDPRKMLRDARALVERGKYVEAAEVAKQFKKIGDVRWGVFEDTPDKLLADIEKITKIPNNKTAPEARADASNFEGTWANKLFAETSKDFGLCAFGTTLKHHFKITNVYNVPLEITGIRATSSCVTWSLPQTTLPPKAETSLEVTVDANRFTGDRSFTILVTVGKEYTSTATLSVKANVIKALREAGEGIEKERPLDSNAPSPNSSKRNRTVDDGNSLLLRSEGAVLESNRSLPRENNTSLPIYEISAREIRIPVMVARNQREELRELRLYVSDDHGKKWQSIATISPDESAFHFVAPQDGVYWLAIQTVNKDGKMHPLTPDIVADLKISIRAKQ